jgi:membrane protein
MSIRNGWKILKNSIAGFFESNVFKLSGALAYFTVFSLPGVLIIIIWFSDIFYRRELIEGTVYKQIEGFVGHSAALDIQETMRNAATSTGGTFATIVGLVALIIGATTIFSEIQDSINQIWHLKAKRKKGFGILKLILNRLLSFSMIITLGFILLVSLVINGAMDLLLDRLMIRYPEMTVILVYILNVALTFLITAFIFAAIFKVLPDARIKWKHVSVGAFVTAFLFMLGKFLISYYLGHNKMTSTYGTAGSVIVILLWVYYSSAILYFGAIFTREYVLHRGSRIYPNSYAVWVQQIEVESEKSVQPTHKTVVEVAPKEPAKTSEDKKE